MGFLTGTVVGALYLFFVIGIGISLDERGKSGQTFAAVALGIGFWLVVMGMLGVFS